MPFRKLSALLLAMSVLPLQALAAGTTEDTFSGGGPEALADLSGPGHSAEVSITLPAASCILSAAMNVTGVEISGSYPLSPGVSLDGNLLWAFNGTGYGAFGRQELFSDGAGRMTALLGPGGGTCSTSIRLPAGAFVQNATAMLRAGGPLAGFEQVFDATGQERDMYGSSVSGAGDVNRDGLDDVLIGARMNKQGAGNGGRAYLHFGSRSMDNIPELTFSSNKEYGYLGESVSGAGDVNGDGYDDFVLGAPGEGDNWRGQAYIHFGGPALDTVPDVVLSGEGWQDSFGMSVSGAGDVNRDGYDDVIVGAPWNDALARDAGRAYIFFGGQAMDDRPDVVLTGDAYTDEFGMGVSTAGDLNSDGYDDVVVGARCYNGYRPGYAHVYFGGKAMDAVPELDLEGKAPGDWFGVRVSDAGDVNADGYDDVIIGSDLALVFIYFGGAEMDDACDLSLPAGDASGAGDVNGDGADDVAARGYWTNGSSNERCIDIYLGGKGIDDVPEASIRGVMIYTLCAVSGAGDVNGDGLSDIVAGGHDDDTAGVQAGRACLFAPTTGILNASLTVGTGRVWSKGGISNGTARSRDFSNELNHYMRSASPSGTDAWGNSYIDIPAVFDSTSQGTLELFDLNITYRSSALVRDLASPLNDHICAHRDDRDADGNLTVPLAVRSSNGGGLRFSGLGIVYDGPPALVEPIPDLEMDEDSANYSLLDLRRHFTDDCDPPDSLAFAVEGVTGAGFVGIGVSGRWHLTADARTGTANDNWTGAVSLRVRCTDTRGFSALSNLFNLTIRNVNDPPVITSLPPTVAIRGLEYGYRVTAVDGDGDTLSFSLSECPPNMTVSSTGDVSWLPTENGVHGVTVEVGDGRVTVSQPYNIEVTGDHPPRFTSVPATNATVGVRYFYDARASDPDQDRLAFSIVKGPKGMTCDPATGAVSWTPARSDVGDHDVTVRVEDGRGGFDLQSFTITVVGPPAPPPVAPRCGISHPANGTQVRGRLQVRGSAAAGSAPLTAVLVRLDGGNWTAAAGTENWTLELDTATLAGGRHVLEARSFDGSLSSDIASVEFVVRGPEPEVTMEGPPWPLAWVAVLVVVMTAAFLLVRRALKRRAGP